MDPGFNIRDFLETDELTQEQIDRCEFWVTANRITRESGTENFCGSKIQVNNNWDLDKLEEWLEDYHDKKVVDYLRYGWPLNANNTVEDCTIPINQKGARENGDKVQEYLSKQIEEGTIIGPFIRNPFGRSARFSPIDAIPKKYSSELRIILNLSYPRDSGSVNESIDTDHYGDESSMMLRYPSVDDLAKIVRKKGRKAWIFKRDLSKAYKQLFNSPNSINLLGFTFKGKMYFEVTLSMGSHSAAFCCQRTTNAITHVYQKHGFDDVNYLDDLGAAEEESKAEEAYDCLGWILDTIGIKESTQKACPPAYIAIFLGILFNTITMTMQITEERLSEIKNILEVWIDKEVATLKEIQSLLGKLNFAASTVRAGRVFVSRLINTLKQFPEKGHKRLDKDLKKDIEWWYQFMEEFDGITIMPPIDWNAPDTVISSDSSLQGCGGWAEGDAFHCQFPDWLNNRTDMHINEKELMAFVIALKIWKHKVKNKNLLAYCDNETTVAIVNTGKANNRFAQACLREICYLTAKENSVIKLVHISSEQNRISDCLSRWDKPQKREEFWAITTEFNVKFEEINENMFMFTHDW